MYSLEAISNRRTWVRENTLYRNEEDADALTIIRGSHKGFFCWGSIQWQLKSNYKTFAAKLCQKGKA